MRNCEVLVYTAVANSLKSILMDSCVNGASCAGNFIIVIQPLQLDVSWRCRETYS